MTRDKRVDDHHVRAGAGQPRGEVGPDESESACDQAPPPGEFNGPSSSTRESTRLMLQRAPHAPCGPARPLA